MDKIINKLTNELDLLFQLKKKIKKNIYFKQYK